MSEASYVPQRGDVVWISLSPQAGHEQAGRRPVVVLSPEAYNSRVGLAVFCPVTHQVKGYPFEVRIPDGLPVSGAALSDQVRTMDWRARNVEPICSLPPATIGEILGKLAALLS